MNIPSVKTATWYISINPNVQPQQLVKYGWKEGITFVDADF